MEETILVQLVGRFASLCAVLRVRIVCLGGRGLVTPRVREGATCARRMLQRSAKDLICVL